MGKEKMARVIIAESLKQAIGKKFKQEAATIFSLMATLREQPKKGKLLAVINNIAIKELKYEKYRFYFVADNYRLRFLPVHELTDLLIKFVRMSEKKDQQQTIEDIKHILRQLGTEGF